MATVTPAEAIQAFPVGLSIRATETPAEAVGIQSFPLAVAFAIIYAPLALLYILLIFKFRSRPVFSLAVFCVVRVGAFAIRAHLAQSGAVGEKGLLTAEQVMTGAGFVGVLDGVFSFVNNWIERYQGEGLPLFGKLFHIALAGAVALTVIGANKASSDDPSSGNAYRIGGTLLFLALTLFFCFRSLAFFKEQHSSHKGKVVPLIGFGARHASTIYAAASVLFLVREGFSTATLGSKTTAMKEEYFYPFTVIPELLAVILLVIPGVIPPKIERDEDGAYAAEPLQPVPYGVQAQSGHAPYGLGGQQMRGAGYV